MKYAALVTMEKSIDDGWNGSNLQTFTELEKFKDRKDMEEWVQANTVSPYGKVYTLIEYNELQVKTTVTVEVK